MLPSAKKKLLSPPTDGITKSSPAKKPKKLSKSTTVLAKSDLAAKTPTNDNEEETEDSDSAVKASISDEEREMELYIKDEPKDEPADTNLLAAAKEYLKNEIEGEEGDMFY